MALYKVGGVFCEEFYNIDVTHMLGRLAKSIEFVL